MLKTSIINNTWICDNCNLETLSIPNPYFQITIQNGGSAICPYTEIDLCDTCMDLITIQPIVDYVATVDSIPKG